MCQITNTAVVQDEDLKTKLIQLNIFIERSYFLINGSLSLSEKGILSNHSTENDWDFWFAVFVNTIIPLTSILLFNGWIIKVIIMVIGILEWYTDIGI